MPFQCLWTHTAAPRSHRSLWHDRSCHLEWPSPAGLHLTEPSQLIRAPPLPPLPASPALFLKAPFGQYYILWTLTSSFSNTLSPSIAMPTTHRLTCLSNPWINVPETTSGIVLLTSEWITTPYNVKYTLKHCVLWVYYINQCSSSTEISDSQLSQRGPLHLTNQSSSKRGSLPAGSQSTFCTPRPEYRLEG